MAQIRNFLLLLHRQGAEENLERGRDPARVPRGLARLGLTDVLVDLRLEARHLGEEGLVVDTVKVAVGQLDGLVVHDGLNHLRHKGECVADTDHLGGLCL